MPLGEVVVGVEGAALGVALRGAGEADCEGAEERSCRGADVPEDDGLGSDFGVGAASLVVRSLRTGVEVVPDLGVSVGVDTSFRRRGC